MNDRRLIYRKMKYHGFSMIKTGSSGFLFRKDAGKYRLFFEGKKEKEWSVRFYTDAKYNTGEDIILNNSWNFYFDNALYETVYEIGYNLGKMDEHDESADSLKKMKKILDEFEYDFL